MEHVLGQPVADLAALDALPEQYRAVREPRVGAAEEDRVGQVEGTQHPGGHLVADLAVLDALPEEFVAVSGAGDSGCRGIGAGGPAGVVRSGDGGRGAVRAVPGGGVEVDGENGAAAQVGGAGRGAGSGVPGARGAGGDADLVDARFGAVVQLLQLGREGGSQGFGGGLCTLPAGVLRAGLAGAGAAAVAVADDLHLGQRQSVAPVLQGAAGQQVGHAVDAGEVLDGELLRALGEGEGVFGVLAGDGQVLDGQVGTGGVDPGQFLGDPGQLLAGAVQQALEEWRNDGDLHVEGDAVLEPVGGALEEDAAGCGEQEVTGVEAVFVAAAVAVAGGAAGDLVFADAEAVDEVLGCEKGVAGAVRGVDAVHDGADDVHLAVAVASGGQGRGSAVHGGDQHVGGGAVGQGQGLAQTLAAEQLVGLGLESGAGEVRGDLPAQHGAVHRGEVGVGAFEELEDAVAGLPGGGPGELDVCGADALVVPDLAGDAVVGHGHGGLDRGGGGGDGSADRFLEPVRTALGHPDVDGAVGVDHALDTGQVGEQFCGVLHPQAEGDGRPFVGEALPAAAAPGEGGGATRVVGGGGADRGDDVVGTAEGGGGVVPGEDPGGLGGDGRRAGVGVGRAVHQVAALLVPELGVDVGRAETLHGQQVAADGEVHLPAADLERLGGVAASDQLRELPHLVALTEEQLEVVGGLRAGLQCAGGQLVQDVGAQAFDAADRLGVPLVQPECLVEGFQFVLVPALGRALAEQADLLTRATGGGVAVGDGFAVGGGAQAGSGPGRERHDEVDGRLGAGGGVRLGTCLADSDGQAVARELEVDGLPSDRRPHVLGHRNDGVAHGGAAPAREDHSCTHRHERFGSGGDEHLERHGDALAAGGAVDHHRLDVGRRVVRLGTLLARSCPALIATGRGVNRVGAVGESEVGADDPAAAVGGGHPELDAAVDQGTAPLLVAEPGAVAIGCGPQGRLHGTLMPGIAERLENGAAQLLRHGVEVVDATAQAELPVVLEALRQTMRDLGGHMLGRGTGGHGIGEPAVTRGIDRLMEVRRLRRWHRYGVPGAVLRRAGQGGQPIGPGGGGGGRLRVRTVGTGVRLPFFGSVVRRLGWRLVIDRSGCPGRAENRRQHVGLRRQRFAHHDRVRHHLCHHDRLLRSRLENARHPRLVLADQVGKLRAEPVTDPPVEAVARGGDLGVVIRRVCLGEPLRRTGELVVRQCVTVPLDLQIADPYSVGVHMVGTPVDGEGVLPAVGPRPGMAERRLGEAHHIVQAGPEVLVLCGEALGQPGQRVGVASGVLGQERECHRFEQRHPVGADHVQPVAQPDVLQDPLGEPLDTAEFREGLPSTEFRPVRHAVQPADRLVDRMPDLVAKRPLDEVAVGQYGGHAPHDLAVRAEDVRGAEPLVPGLRACVHEEALEGAPPVQFGVEPRRQPEGRDDVDELAVALVGAGCALVRVPGLNGQQLRVGLQMLGRESTEHRVETVEHGVAEVPGVLRVRAGPDLDPVLGSQFPFPFSGTPVPQDAGDPLTSAPAGPCDLRRFDVLSQL